MMLIFAPKMIAVFVAASPMATFVGGTVRSPDKMKWRQREGAEFFRFLRERRATVQ